MELTIAQFISSLHLAGQERVAVDLAKAFLGKGHNSLVCTTAMGGKLEKELEVSNVPFQCLKLKKSYGPGALIRVMHYLKDNGVNVVITHGNYRYIPRLAAILSRIPVVIHVEHSMSDSKRKYHILINKVLSLFTDRIVCVSESVRQSLLRIEKSEQNKLVVIRNGVGTERFCGPEQGRARQDNAKRVGIVGRFIEQKGHIYFVEAATKVVATLGDVEFIFAGDGPLRPIIEQKVKECGLETRSSFLGVRSDIDQLLPTFDIFVLPSLSEGLPISLLEAQYFGVASIVTNVGGNPEVVEDGYNGLLVPPGDPDALAAAILRMLSDDKLRHELGLRGKEVFSRNFSVAKMTDAYLELIKNVFHRNTLNSSHGSAHLE